MNRVMVTGARGLLGSSLVPHLKDRGYKVLCHSRKDDTDYNADLTNIEQVRHMLDTAVPNVIVNLAAMTDVDLCEEKPQLAYLNNVKIVENLIKWILVNPSCYFVQLSTDQVYDGFGPHAEEDLLLSNYYGFSKYAGELAASLVPSTILRTNFFGRSRCMNRMSFSDWLIDSIKKEKKINVFSDVRFSPLSMNYLSELLEIVILKREVGTFNLGSKYGMSKADFAFTFAELLNLPTHTIKRNESDILKLTAYRPKDMCMNSALFENTFNVNLPSLQEEINSMKGVYAYDN